MTFADHVCDLTEWVIRYSYVILIISMAVTTCLAYMAGYYDGYHAGAVIYVGGQP